MVKPQDRHKRTWAVEDGAANVWRRYSADEDRYRTNLHYDLPAEFITTFTAGEWNVYSCNLWDGSSSVTDSQERKLDLLARCLDLQRGQRVLDVGCGWGGPLVYLAERYGIRGAGLTLSPNQKEFADRRIQEHGVDVKIHVSHWSDFADPLPFDAVYTDEVIVHFNDLRGFFERVRALLKPGGLLLNKELHFTSRRFMELTRAMIFLNDIFGETGNYRMLHEELALLDETGFILERIEQIPIVDYARTADGWLLNLQANRQRLEELVGRDHYERFRKYLRMVRRIHGSTNPPMTLEVVVARAPSGQAGFVRSR
jgi:cyclopropane-fatty-acyl-phospholipid synthase